MTLRSDPQHGHRCAGLPWCDRCFDIACAEFINMARHRRRHVKRHFSGWTHDQIVAFGVWTWMFGGPGPTPYPPS